jgi:ribosome maturation protein Sdo1
MENELTTSPRIPDPFGVRLLPDAILPADRKALEVMGSMKQIMVIKVNGKRVKVKTPRHYRYENPTDVATDQKTLNRLRESAGKGCRMFILSVRFQEWEFGKFQQYCVKKAPAKAQYPLRSLSEKDITDALTAIFNE